MSESPFAYLPVPENHNADYKKQCIEVPGTKRPGQTGMTLPLVARVFPADTLTSRSHYSTLSGMYVHRIYYDIISCCVS